MTLTVTDSSLHTLFSRYLDTLYVEQDFAAHHALHSDDAFVLAGPQVDRLRDLPQGQYAAYMRDSLQHIRWDRATLRARTPCFSTARVHSLHSGDDSVALVWIREEQRQQDLLAVFGIVHDPRDDRWRLRWVTLWPAGEAPPAADAGMPAQRVQELHAQADAELAMVPPLYDERSLLLSLLEVAYWRQHLVPQEVLSYLPEARFTCHMSARCCTVNWGIRLTANDRAALDARNYGQRLPLALGRPLYRALPRDAADVAARPYELNKGQGHRCVFLTAADRCVVHEDTGTAVFHDCHVFPYGFTFTPDGVAVWTNLICPSSRYNKGRGFAENEADIRGRLQRVRRPPLPVLQRRAGQPVSWPEFRAAEEGLLRYLDEPVALRLRLLAGARWLSRWPEGGPVPAYDPALLDAEAALRPAAEADRVWVRQVMGQFLHVDYFQAQPPPQARVPQRYVDEDLSEAPFLPYLLRTLVFSKRLSYRHGVVPGWSFMVLAYCLLVRRFAGWGHADIPASQWESALMGLQHSFFQLQVTELMEHDDVLRQRSQRPDLAEVLLRATLVVDPMERALAQLQPGHGQVAGPARGEVHQGG